MKRAKILSVLWCAIAASAFLPAAFSQDKDKPLNLVLTNNPSDFWTITRAGCEQAVKEIPNIKLEFKMPADGTAAEQTRIFDDLLVKGINGIALSPVDPSNQTAMIDKGTEKALVGGVILIAVSLDQILTARRRAREARIDVKAAPAEPAPAAKG